MTEKCEHKLITYTNNQYQSPHNEEIRDSIFSLLSGAGVGGVVLLGGAMVLGKLLVPGHPTNLDYSMAGAYCACSRCRWWLFGHFFSSIISLFFLLLSGTWPDIH